MMATITKKELVNRIAERTGQTKVVAKEILQMFLDEIVKELSSGNRLEFRDFGVFEVKPRRARRAQNPRTLQKVEVPPKRVVKFKVGRVMRDLVSDGLSKVERKKGSADARAEVDADAPAEARKGSGNHVWSALDRPPQVLFQVVRNLDADGDPQQPVLEAASAPHLRRDRRVGHRRRVLDQRLDAAEALGAGEEAGRRRHPLPAL